LRKNKFFYFREGRILLDQFKGKSTGIPGEKDVADDLLKTATSEHPHPQLVQWMGLP